MGLLARAARILHVFSAGLVLILAMNMFWPYPKRSYPFREIEQASSLPVGQQVKVFAQKMVDAEALAFREGIFKWPFTMAAQDVLGSQTGQPSTGVEQSLANNWKVIGVLRGIKSSVFVRDLANDKTLLLTMGEKGDPSLEKIDGHRVTLRSQGQSWELLF